MNAEEIIKEAHPFGDDAVAIELWYPRLDTNPIKAIIVGLMDVRAADDIRISYDFDRDGWKIEQASIFQWPAGDNTDHDQDWQEVAFVKAWGRARPDTFD